jgi:hypothetical protein
LARARLVLILVGLRPHELVVGEVGVAEVELDLPLHEHDHGVAHDPLTKKAAPLM